MTTQTEQTKIKKLRNKLKNRCVIVSNEEWLKLEDELKLELIALSHMEGEEITNYLNKEDKNLYDKLMYNWDLK